jgi:hypothetical protein
LYDATVFDRSYKPTSSGERPEWENEQEALDWFTTSFGPLVAEQVEIEEFIAALSSANEE